MSRAAAFSETPVAQAGPRGRLMTHSRLVTVNIKDSNGSIHQLQVHANVLIDSSTWFATRLANGQVSEVDCPHGSIDIFRYFKEFVYTGIVAKGVPRGKPAKTVQLDIPVTYKNLDEPWLLGEKLGALKFQDECLRTWNLKRFSDYQENTPHKGLKEIQHVWAKTDIGCPLRKFLVDSYANMDLDVLFSTDPGFWRLDFVLDVAKANAKKQKDGTFNDTKDFWRTRNNTAFNAKHIEVVEIQEDVHMDLVSSDEDEDATLNDDEPTAQQARAPAPRLREQDDTPPWMNMAHRPAPIRRSNAPTPTSIVPESPIFHPTNRRHTPNGNISTDSRSRASLARDSIELLTSTLLLLHKHNTQAVESKSLRQVLISDVISQQLANDHKMGKLGALVVVTAKHASMPLHKARLAEISKAFAQVLDEHPQLNESSDHGIVLGTASARLLNLGLQEFVYVKSLDNDSGNQLTRREVLELYVLAKDLGAPMLQDECLKHWNRLQGRKPVWSLADVEYVYSVASDNPTSVLRQFMVDSWVHAPKEDAFEGHEPKELPSAFYRDLIIAIEQAEGESKITTKNQWTNRSIAPYKAPQVVKTEGEAYDPAIIRCEIRGGSNSRTAIEVSDTDEDEELPTKSEKKIEIKSRSPAQSRLGDRPSTQADRAASSAGKEPPAPSIEISDKSDNLFVPPEVGSALAEKRKRSILQTDGEGDFRHRKHQIPPWMAPRPSITKGQIPRTK